MAVSFRIQKQKGTAVRYLTPSATPYKSSGFGVEFAEYACEPMNTRLYIHRNFCLPVIPAYAGMTVIFSSTTNSIA